MASYIKHVRFNLFLAFPIILGLIYYFLHPSYHLMITFTAVFFYSTLFMNPDLDIANKIKLGSIRGILTFPFRSYAKIFKHRGISHNLLLGSLTRILWLAMWGVLIFFVLYKTLPTKVSLYRYYQQYHSFILYGLSAVCLADWCHLVLDQKVAKRRR